MFIYDINVFVVIMFADVSFEIVVSINVRVLCYIYVAIFCVDLCYVLVLYIL